MAIEVTKVSLLSEKNTTYNVNDVWPIVDLTEDWQITIKKK